MYNSVQQFKYNVTKSATVGNLDVTASPGM